MSRKPRNRKKFELGLTVHRLTGDLHNTLETLVVGCVLLAQARDPLALLDMAATTVDDDLDEIIGDDADAALDDVVDDALEDELDSLDDALQDVAATTPILARVLIARVLGLEPPPIGPHTILSDAPLSRADRNAALDEASVLLLEVGLEEFDVYCELAIALDGTSELFIQKLSPERAHVRLLEFVFDDAENVALSVDDLIVVERDASSWEFSRWSVSPPPGTRSFDEANFARRIREQEYSLVDHRTISLGDSVIGQLATDHSFAEISPRQHRLAVGLATSVIDVFECVALDGARATLKSVRDARTYAVYEHMDPIVYATGWTCAGRLLPFADGLYLRSPGMIFVQPGNPNLVYEAAASLDLLGETLPPAVALEGTISSVLFGVNVPREKKPAALRAAAREALAAIRSILADAELADELEADAVADALRRGIERRANPNPDIQPDATLAAFMAALAEQAEAGGARSEQQRARRHKNTKRRR